MLRTHKSMFFFFPVLFLFASVSCEHAEKLDTRDLVFEVQSSESAPIDGFYFGEGAFYKISVPGAAFFEQSPAQARDSIFDPSDLLISITLLGELTHSLLNVNGFRVQTQFSLNGGDIRIEHTNQAMQVVSPQGDTLYAVRGEGIISGGEGSFENISGFFSERSTYRIVRPGSGESHIVDINCRYELTVEF